jgi:hypothetical protein
MSDDEETSTNSQPSVKAEKQRQQDAASFASGAQDKSDERKHHKKHKKEKKKKQKKEKKRRKHTKEKKKKTDESDNDIEHHENDDIVKKKATGDEENSDDGSMSSSEKKSTKTNSLCKKTDDDGSEQKTPADNVAAAAAAVSNTNDKTNVMQHTIPKKKRSAPTPTKNSDDDERIGSDDDDDDEDDDDNMEVSLNDLKRSVMGRDLKTDDDSDAEQDEELKQIRALMNPTGGEPDSTADSKSATTALAERLRKDLMCAVCHDVVYPPISLRCGHTFCQPCIEWWFDRVPSCPTCRQSESEGRKYLPAPNLALRSCVMSIFGQEIVSRLQSAKPKGEMGGAHDAGYEVLCEIDDETWHCLQVHQSNLSSSSEVGTIQARRNIVLDADDQRMQLALSIFSRPEKVVINHNEHGFRVKLCILTMEEDEVEDSGFPIDIVNPEDEQLICSRESRFLHSFVDVQMKTENEGRLLPLARVPSDDNGYFDYVLDPSQSAGNPAEARLLIFEHSDTGCRLEVDLAQLQSRAGGDTLRPQMQPRNREQPYDYDMMDDDEEDHRRSRHTRGGFVMGEEDDSDTGSDQDKFEEDGFLIPDQNGGSDVEGAFSEEEDDDDDLCAICKEDGELVICDGGDEDEGCKKSFHIRCINRQIIPEGDWICKDCATSFGIAVGIEGHEFPPKKQKNKSDDEDGSVEEQNNFEDGSSGKRKVIDDSDSEADANSDQDQKGSLQNKKPKRRHVLEESDSE